MRVTTAFSTLLRLKGVWVKKVSFEHDRVVVFVALRRKRLVCPLCELGAEHPHTLSARANLAASYWQAGRSAEAIALGDGGGGARRQ